MLQLGKLLLVAVQRHMCRTRHSGLDDGLHLIVRLAAAFDRSLARLDAARLASAGRQQLRVVDVQRGSALGIQRQPGITAHHH
ncbi:hypothetical protein D3C81_1792230 [compost metagenome]